MTARRDTQLRWALRVAFWLALLFALARALWPDPFTEEYVGPNDKIVHAAAFYVLTVLAAAAYPRTRLLLIGAALWAFGGLIEILQAIPMLHRDAAWGDWAADLAGIALVLAPMALPRVRESLRRR